MLDLKAAIVKVLGQHKANAIKFTDDAEKLTALLVSSIPEPTTPAEHFRKSLYMDLAHSFAGRLADKMLSGRELAEAFSDSLQEYAAELPRLVNGLVDCKLMGARFVTCVIMMLLKQHKTDEDFPSLARRLEAVRHTATTKILAA